MTRFNRPPSLYLMAVIAAALAAALAACEQSPATPAATPEPAPPERTATCADSAIQLVGRSEAVHGAIVQDVLYMGGKTADATCTQDASRALLMLPADAYPEAQTQAASWYLLVIEYAADNIRLYVVRAQDGAECIVDTRNQCIARVTDLAAGFNVDDLPDDVPATVPGGRAPAPEPEPAAPPPPPTSVPAPAGPAGPADDAIDWEAVCPKWPGDVHRVSVYETFGSIPNGRRSPATATISYTLPDPGGKGEPTFVMIYSPDTIYIPRFWSFTGLPTRYNEDSIFGNRGPWRADHRPLNGRTLSFTVKDRSPGSRFWYDGKYGDGSLTFRFSVSNAYVERDDSQCSNGAGRSPAWRDGTIHQVRIYVGTPTPPKFGRRGAGWYWDDHRTTITDYKRTFTKGVATTRMSWIPSPSYGYPQPTVTVTGVPSGMSPPPGADVRYHAGRMGTPDTVGTGTFTATFKNASGTATYSFEWEVKEPETTP